MTLMNTLESRMSYRIARKRQRVFLREDFADLGRGYRQISRVLEKFVKGGKLAKIGYGLYVRTKVSSVSGNVITDGPLPWLAKEFLARRGIEVVPTKAEIAYNGGESTQVPTGRTIGVRSDVTRRIGYDGAWITYEKRP